MTAVDDGDSAPTSGAGFRRVSESVLYQGRVFALIDEVYEAPDGAQFDRQIIRHNGAVAIVPLHEDGTVTLIRQRRVAQRRKAQLARRRARKQSLAHSA